MCQTPWVVWSRVHLCLVLISEVSNFPSTYLAPCKGRCECVSLVVWFHFLSQCQRRWHVVRLCRKENIWVHQPEICHIARWAYSQPRHSIAKVWDFPVWGCPPPARWNESDAVTACDPIKIQHSAKRGKHGIGRASYFVPNNNNRLIMARAIYTISEYTSIICGYYRLRRMRLVLP